MILNEFLGSGPPQNAPEYRKSNLTNSKIELETPIPLHYHYPTNIFYHQPPLLFTIKTHILDSLAVLMACFTI